MGPIAKGPVVRENTVSQFAGFFTAPNKPAYIVLDVTDANGKTESWAVQGNELAALVHDGWTPRGPVALGETLSIVTFRVKGNAAAAMADNPRVMELIKAGRLVKGTEVTLTNEEKKTFGSTK